jgi:hypothetical protein
MCLERYEKEGCTYTYLSLSRLSKLKEILKYQTSERSFNSLWVYGSIHPMGTTWRNIELVDNIENIIRYESEGDEKL